MKFSKRYLPDYSLLHSWELYSVNILTDEGRDIAKYKKLAEEIAVLPVGKAREDMADHLPESMSTAPIRDGYPFVEPDTLPEIQKCRYKRIPRTGFKN
ncbi:MAG: hypothetical protein FWE62_01025 [Firmicutes bacterium]|nr:hypothetical protein [Bacillota bacterium]